MVQTLFTGLRTTLFVAATLLGCGLLSTATAQDAAPGAEAQMPALDPGTSGPPSPVVRPQFTREQAEQMLTTWEATRQFEIVALEENLIGVRHRASGMVCRFAPDFQNRINVARTGSDNSDVGCVSGPWPATMLAAARNNIPLSAYIGTMEQEFRQENPYAQPFEPNQQYWAAPSRDAVYLHLVSTKASGERSVIHAVAFRRGRWTIFSRMTYTASGDLPIIAAELAAAAHFGSVLSDLSEEEN